jgi:serine/threonine-protein kinase
VPQESIGGYAILRRICQTASSELFLATDPRRREEVALKVVLPQLARDKRLLHHYAREADLSRELQHPNLIKVHEFVADAPRPYLVMRFIPGQTLKKAIYREVDLVRARGFHWLVRAAQALGYLHAHGYVHLDVKPENLLITENGQATVIDLALTRHFGRKGLLESIRSRFVGETHGTRSYMSPEQITNRSLGPTTDIYSLGIVIFEMFSRRLPLTATDPNAILQLHLKARPPMLHHVVPEIHPDLSNMVARMLEKAPEARPQSMDTVIETLARIGRPMLKDPPGEKPQG